MRPCPKLAAFVILIGACGGRAGDGGGGGTPGGCSDEDGDGFGIGSECEGADCNDWVASIHTAEECDAWCASGEPAPGCPCDSPEPEACYTGMSETLGIGACAAGITICVEGTWSRCAGEVTPLEETCNETDDDCDGEVDEGLLSECGTCGECEEECIGPAKGCDGWGENTSSGVAETPEGWLTLDGASQTLHVLWPSSSTSGKILRVDTRTTEIQGSYFTGPNHGVAAGAGDSPSRSAVDDFGNVVIANRALGGDRLGSVTKIAADVADCVDGDGDGEIRTSSGWDETLPFDAHDAWSDECIVWHTTVGAAGAVARAVTIYPEFGLDGVLEMRGWVGLYTEQRFLQFDMDTGETTGIEAATPGLTPYGAAVDRDGIVWVTSQANQIGTFDTADPDGSFDLFAMPFGYTSQRVIVDENDAPWVSGSNAVHRWNRETEEWQTADLGVLVGNVASDGQGSVWVGLGRAGAEYVYRIDNDDAMDFHTIDTPGVRTFGMAVDFEGYAWAFGFYTGNAARIDLETEDVQVALNDCDGGPCLEGPYVRGDVTGLQRKNAVDPMGTWSGIVEGCVDGATSWGTLAVEALTPPGSNIVLAMRTADSLAALAATSWTAIGVVPDDGNEFDLGAILQDAGVSAGNLLEVRATLQSLDGLTAPTLQEIGIAASCVEIAG